MNPFKPPLRPPGAVSEKEFPVRCIRCGRCVETCPHDSIRLVEGFGASRLTPHVIPSEHPCLLCMKCPPVCPSGALDNTLTDMKRVHMGRAFILRDRCHNYTDGTIRPLSPARTRGGAGRRTDPADLVSLCGLRYV